MAQYSCKWNSHAQNMMSVMDSLKGVENFVDVTLMSEGRALKAHKLVLSTCSPLFHQMFLANPCAHPIVFLADLKFSTLKAIIDFIYKGEVSFEENELELLLKGAKALEIKGLTDVCREKLITLAVEGENGAKGTSPTQFRSPRKKRPRMQSSEVRVEFDESVAISGTVAKEDEMGIAEELDVHAENGSTEEEDGAMKPVGQVPNVRIKQDEHGMYPTPQAQIISAPVHPPLRRKKRSKIWNFFTPLNRSVARCNTCLKEMSYRTSISNLSCHMQSMHSKLDYKGALKKTDDDEYALQQNQIYDIEEQNPYPLIHKL